MVTHIFLQLMNLARSKKFGRGMNLTWSLAMAKKQNQKPKVKVTATMQPEAPKPKFSVQAGSMESKITPIFSRGKQVAPSVYYTPKAWTKIKRAIEACSKEVGWLGLVEVIEDGNYLITDIFIPKQTVTGTETDIDAEDMADLAMSLEEPEKLLYWGHSHVNMGVGPSGQDEQQTAEYLEHADFFIRGIYNKKGDSKVDVFDMKENLVYQKVRNVVKLDALSPEESEAFEKELSDNVKERTYVNRSIAASTPSYGYYDSYGGFHDKSSRGQSDFGFNRTKEEPVNPFLSRKMGVK